MQRVLLLSAYDAESHRRWRKGLVENLPEFDWTVLTLPPRFFSWRLRGNPLSWAYLERETLEKEYDCLFATSMVDLAILRGIMPSLASLPTLLYFHENQFVYPIRAEVQREQMHFCMHNLYNALAADKVLYNSEYNFQSYQDGLAAMLKRMPDFVPKGVGESIADKSEIVPVPLELDRFQPGTGKGEGPLSVLWNHRWEYDKAPDRFFRALELLKERGVPFHLHVVGQEFRQKPEAFDEGKERLGEEIVTWGYLPSREDYQKLLQSCDVVISTALHEFQGLAVLEATASGCRPVAPNRLAYPNWLPEECLYPSFPDDAEREASALAEHLAGLAERLSELRGAAPLPLEHLSWKHLAPRYRKILSQMCDTHSIKNNTN